MKRVISPERLMNAAVIDRVMNPEIYLVTSKADVEEAKINNGKVEVTQSRKLNKNIVKDVGNAYFQHTLAIGKKNQFWALKVYESKKRKHYDLFLTIGKQLLQTIKEHPGATNPLYWLARDWFKAVYSRRTNLRRFSGATMYSPSITNWQIFDIWVVDKEKESGESYWKYEPVGMYDYDRKEQAMKQTVNKAIAGINEAEKQVRLNQIRMDRDRRNAKTPEEMEKHINDVIAGVYDHTMKEG